MSATPTIDMYWDFSSPFGYLASTQMEVRAARVGANVEWRPVLLGGLFRAIGTADVPMATFPEAKQRYYLADLHRWAERWSVPFRFPSSFPIRSLKALRLYLALPEARRPSFREATYRAAWAFDRNIDDDAVLAESVGDEATFRDASLRAGSDEIKAALRAATESAAARGVFGVPTMIVGDELYWGQDRVDLMFERLQSPATVVSPRT